MARGTDGPGVMRQMLSGLSLIPLADEVEDAKKRFENDCRRDVWERVMAPKKNRGTGQTTWGSNVLNFVSEPVKALNLQGAWPSMQNSFRDVGTVLQNRWNVPVVPGF